MGVVTICVFIYCDFQKTEDVTLAVQKQDKGRVIFKVIKDMFSVQSLPNSLIGSQVNLASVIVQIIREQRLHKVDKETVEMNIKLDGRPFWGQLFVYFIISRNF